MRGGRVQSDAPVAVFTRLLGPVGKGQQGQELRLCEAGWLWDVNSQGRVRQRDDSLTVSSVRPLCHTLNCKYNVAHADLCSWPVAANFLILASAVLLRLTMTALSFQELRDFLHSYAPRVD